MLSIIWQSNRDILRLRTKLPVVGVLLGVAPLLLHACVYLRAEDLHSCGQGGEEEGSGGAHTVPQHQHSLIVPRHQAQPLIILIKLFIAT